MRCGEKLHADGTLDQSNIDVFVKQRDPRMQYQTDTYILKGGGPEVWSPRFTYHGFQYVEMTGFPGRPTLENLRGLVVHSSMLPTGHFECSNALLNAIQHNTLWSYLSNFQSIPTDCPHREKNGWTGDAQLAAEQGMYNFGSAANYAKWLNDLEDEQRPGGELPGIVPSAGWGYAWGNGPAWDSAYPLICWYLYQYYGDARPLQQHYEHLRRYVDYLTSRAQGGIVSIGLGDWVAPGPTAPVAETDTAYYYRDALIVAQAATLCGKTDEARRYTELAATIKRAFNAKFYDAQTHSYADGSQTALSCALYQGLVEPEQREAVVQNLVAAVDKHDGHIFTGILGAKYVMNTLLDNDRTAVAYRIATQKTAPGWGNWIERGATTLWEDWNGSSSLNHIMFGDISAWFYKALAGINGDPAAPGFKHFFIKPQVVGDLTSARGDYDSIHGTISSAWQVANGQFSLTVTVPVNTSATVFLPGTDASQVLEAAGPQPRRRALSCCALKRTIPFLKSVAGLIISRCQWRTAPRRNLNSGIYLALRRGHMSMNWTDITTALPEEDTECLVAYDSEGLEVHAIATYWPVEGIWSDEQTGDPIVGVYGWIKIEDYRESQPQIVPDDAIVPPDPLV